MFVYGQEAEEIYYRTDRNYYVVKYWNEFDSEYVMGTYIPGNQVEPLPAVKVMMMSDSSFHFNYTVKSGSKSLRALYEVKIFIQSDLNSITKPNSDWDLNYRKDDYISWAKVGGKFRGILPEQSEKGFSFSSEDLPGLVESTFSSKIMILFPDNGPSSDIRIKLDNLVDSTSHVPMETVGPVPEIKNLGIDSLKDQLSFYLTRSCEELGWITNQGICNSLEVKLQNTKRHLENEKLKPAANTLNAFLNEVEGQKDKALSSEAYALLYFNGQYLLEKLKANED